MILVLIHWERCWKVKHVTNIVGEEYIQTSIYLPLLNSKNKKQKIAIKTFYAYSGKLTNKQALTDQWGRNEKQT